MPIQIPNDLPAAGVLQQENIFVMPQNRAARQDIRPLEILLLNLMPSKIVTETQLSRLLGNTPLQVHLELIHTTSHTAKNTPQEHLLSFYKTFDEVKDRKFDGMVITGAPVEQLPFEEVDYWPELCEIMEWSKTHVHSTFHICWGAQAGLYYHYGIRKHPLPQKLFGVFPHQADYKKAILLRGFDDTFYAPHSRHTTVYREDIEAHPELRILASSQEAGVYAVMTKGAARFSSPATRNTTRTPWSANTCGTKTRVSPFRYPPTTTPTTTTPSPPWCAGGATPICFSPTG